MTPKTDKHPSAWSGLTERQELSALTSMGSIAKTTLYLPKEVHRRLKAEAVRRGRSMTELVGEGIERVLTQEETSQDGVGKRRRADAFWRRIENGIGRGARQMARDHDEIYRD